MLKFTTTTPFDENMPIDEFLKVAPLVKPDDKCKLIAGAIKGKTATIKGRALQLAGFYLPCFFDGMITELDKENATIIMVLPSGEYNVTATLDENKIYQLDIK